MMIIWFGLSPKPPLLLNVTGLLIAVRQREILIIRWMDTMGRGGSAMSMGLSASLGFARPVRVRRAPGVERKSTKRDNRPRREGNGRKRRRGNESLLRVRVAKSRMAYHCIPRAIRLGELAVPARVKMIPHKIRV
jgi:hypothetical protein